MWKFPPLLKDPLEAYFVVHRHRPPVELLTLRGSRSGHIPRPTGALSGGMEITLRYFEGCPNWQTARDRIREAVELAGLGDHAEITFELVTTEEEAERLRFQGSPTILIGGIDPFAEGEAPCGLSCRIYQTERAMEGSPSVTQLLEALGGRH